MVSIRRRQPCSIGSKPTTRRATRKRRRTFAFQFFRGGGGSPPPLIASRDHELEKIVLARCQNRRARRPPYPRENWQRTRRLSHKRNTKAFAGGLTHPRNLASHGRRRRLPHFDPGPHEIAPRPK